MKPDWDKLMDAFADSETALVGDVDCTAAGKPLCDANGVQGFPTIKWGDPSNLEDYQGGRDYDSLEKFANENLKPMCSPANIDLCDDDKKATIEKFLGLAEAELEKLIEEKEKLLADAEDAFKTGVEGLQAEIPKNDGRQGENAGGHQKLRARTHESVQGPRREVERGKRRALGTRVFPRFLFLSSRLFFLAVKRTNAFISIVLC